MYSIKSDSSMLNITAIVVIAATMLAGLSTILLSITTTPVPQQASAVCESVEPPNYEGIKPGAQVCQNKNSDEGDKCNIVTTSQEEPSQQHINISCNTGQG